jgi:filamentous hemagglutinin family protein
MFASTSCQKRGRRRMIAWAASWTAMSIMHAAFAGRNVQVDRVSRGTATFSTSGSLTTITASNRAIINYTQFNIADGETVQFVQPSRTSRVLNRINSNAPSMLDGTLLANGIVYFVNPAGVMFGPHSIVNVSGIIAAAGNITDNDFATGIDHFSGSAALVNSGTINAGSAQLVGQSVANRGTINTPGGLVEMIAGQDVMLGSTSSNILVKIGTTIPHGGVSNDGTINAAGGSASLVSGDLYSMALGTPSVIKANQVNIQGGNVALSGKIDASNSAAGATGGSVTVTGQTIAVSRATIDASGAAGGGTIRVGGDFHAASDLPLSQTTSVSADSTLTADATVTGNGGQVAIWSSQQTNFAGQISARGADTGTGGFAEISSKGTLLYPGSVYVGGPGGAGTALLDPATFVIAPIGGDATGGEIATDVTTSGGNFDVTATSEIDVHDTVDISGTTNTLTLDAPTIDFTKPIIINAGPLNLLGGVDVAVANIHNGALIQNGIDIFSSPSPGVPFPVVNIDAGTYAEAVNVRESVASNPITFIAGGAVSITSLTVGLSHPAYFEGSFTANGGFTFNDRIHVGLASPLLGTAQDLILAGPITINNDDGINSKGSIDTNDRNLTLITDSLSISPLAMIDNFNGTSGQGMLNIQPATASDTIGIGDITPPNAMIRIDPVDNIGGDLRMVAIGSPTGSGAITLGTSTFFTPVTIQSPATGGTISVNGQFNGTFFNVGALTLDAPATAGSVAINAPIVMTAAGVSVVVNAGTALSANITTERSPITINGDVVLGGSATLDTTSGHTTGIDAIGADVSIASVSNGNGHNLTLNSGTTGTINVAGNMDDVALLTITESDGTTFGGTIGAGTPGAVTIDDTQSNAAVNFENAVQITALTAQGTSHAYDLLFDSTSGAQTSTIHDVSIATSGMLVLNSSTTDAITFTDGLNFQTGSTQVIGLLAVGTSAHIDLGSTLLKGDTNITAGTTTFHGPLTGAFALIMDGNAAFDSFVPTFASLHVSGNTDFTAATISTTGTQEYDGDVTLHGSGGSDAFNGAGLIIGGTLAANNANVTINTNSSLNQITAVNDLQINGNASFHGAINVGSLAVTGTTDINASSITAVTTQTFNNSVSLSADTTLRGTMISFNSTIEGNAHNLTIDADVLFGDVVSQVATLTVTDDATINADITTTGAQSFQNVVLGADITLNTPSTIFMNSVNGNSHNLTVNAFSVGVLNSTDFIPLLTINAMANFDGDFGQSAPGIVDINNSSGSVNFNGLTHISTLNTAANSYSISFQGFSNQIDHAAVFNNTGGVTFAGFPTATTLFVAGATNTAGPTTIEGTVKTAGAPLGLADLNLIADAILDTTNGGVSPTGGAISLASVTGNSHSLALNSGSSGAISASGDTSGVLQLTVTNSSGATFSGNVSLDTVTLGSTTGTITFNGTLTANTLNDAGGNFDLQFLDSATTITNAVTLGTTGTVTFGDGVIQSVHTDVIIIGQPIFSQIGNSQISELTFVGGVTHSAGPNVINGNISTRNAPIDLNSPTTIAGTSILMTGSGEVTLGDTTIAANSGLDIGHNPYDISIISANSDGDFGANQNYSQSGNITVASISGSSTSNINFATSGNVNVTGAVGSSAAPVSNLQIYDSRTANFGGDIFSSGDINVAAFDTAGDAGSGNMVFHGNLSAGGQISLQAGTDLTLIANVPNAYAASTITFLSNTLTAVGNIYLAAPDEIAYPASTVTVPSVANIIALGSPTTINGFTGIALNIQAASLNMGSEGNMSIPTGGAAISVSRGLSTLSSITALGSIAISASSQATVGVVNRGNWSVLTPSGKLVHESGTIFFAGGVNQPNILSTPDTLPTDNTLSKFASSFATTNAQAGQATVLKPGQLLTARDLQYPANAAQYYLLAAVPTKRPPITPTVIAVGALGINQQYIQENILFDSSMRKQFYHFGLYGRDITLDTVDGGVTGAGEPSEAGALDITPMRTPATQP